jgi:hypothetical protein
MSGPVGPQGLPNGGNGHVGVRSPRLWLGATLLGLLGVGVAVGAEGGVAVEESIRIAFQSVDSPAPSAGYVADVGFAFGERDGHLSYGWNVDNTANGRDRGLMSDPRLSRLIHFQNEACPEGVWEIAVPNGTYTVTLCAGDPCNFDSLYRTQVEGVLAIDGAPSMATPWFVKTVVVAVTDGRLTVANAPGARNNKLCALEIAPGERPVVGWVVSEKLRAEAVSLNIQRWMTVANPSEARRAMEEGSALLATPELRSGLAQQFERLAQLPLPEGPVDPYTTPPPTTVEAIRRLAARAEKMREYTRVRVLAERLHEAAQTTPAQRLALAPIIARLRGLEKADEPRIAASQLQEERDRLLGQLRYVTEQLARARDQQAEREDIASLETIARSLRQRLNANP